jgi:hypothetical protein
MMLQRGGKCHQTYQQTGRWRMVKIISDITNNQHEIIVQNSGRMNGSLQ